MDSEAKLNEPRCSNSFNLFTPSFPHFFQWWYQRGSLPLLNFNLTPILCRRFRLTVCGWLKVSRQASMVAEWELDPWPSVSYIVAHRSKHMKLGMPTSRGHVGSPIIVLSFQTIEISSLGNNGCFGGWGQGPSCKQPWACFDGEGGCGPRDNLYT